MLKQLFKNVFKPKDAKFGFNIEFINGTLNHNPINNIKRGKCQLNFENQAFTIKQKNEILTDYMTDVNSIRTWTFQGNVYFAISTKTYNEYTFSFGTVDFWLKTIEKYANLFDIPFEYCGESKEYDDETDT